MPSGSRGGGGGGGRSGGGHSGGGGWGRSGGGHSRPPRSYGYRHGHRVVFIHGSSGAYMRTSHDVLLNFLRIIAGICFFIFFSFTASCFAETGDIKNIEREYTKYQQMIVDARAFEAQGKDYIILAKVTSYATEFDSSGKYYINYVFQTQNGFDVSGYTFDTYTLERAKEIYYEGYIEIAVNQNPITSYTDSIDVEYENKKLEDDGQYLYYTNLERTCRTVSICSICGTIGCLVLYAVLQKKLTKNDDGESPAPTTNTSVEGQTEQRYSYTTNVNYPPRKKRKCMYCNSRIKDGEITCSRCGATIRDDE